MLDVAACIVTYRSELGKLHQAVDSFRAQEGIKGALTLVDNASGADYMAQLRQIEGVSLIESGANRGFGFGHNIGIRAAPPHRYYLVMNPDVVIHPGTLRIMIDYMDRHPDIGLLLPQLRHPDGSLQYLNKRLPSVFDFFARRFLPKKLQQCRPIARKLDHFVMKDVGYDAPCEVAFASGCFMLFRAEALQQAGLFDEAFFMYLEDCDIGRRVAAFAKVMYIPDAVVTHHWARGSHHSWRLTWVMIRSMFHYYHKWGWKWL